MFSLCIDDYAHNINVFVEKVFVNFKFKQIEREYFVKNKKIKLFQFNYEHYGHYLQTVHDNFETIHSVVWHITEKCSIQGMCFLLC